MYKIGVDIVKISRIEKITENKSFLNKVFTEKEIEHCRTAQSFAGIYAAKEAYFKALGTGLRLPLCNVEILHDNKGKPFIASLDKCDVSISHDGEYAVAAVILWE